MMDLAGQIIVRLDKKDDLLRKLALDTYYLLDRVSKQTTILEIVGKPLAMSVFHCNSLCTRMNWGCLGQAFGYWTLWFLLLSNDHLQGISIHECSFSHAVFATSNPFDSDGMNKHLLYMSTKQMPQGTCYLQMIRLDYVYHHTVFECPGVGVHLQCVGFTVGTNCAPQWSQLSLRAFENQT